MPNNKKKEPERETGQISWVLLGILWTFIVNIMEHSCQNVVFSYFVLLCCVSPLLVLSFPSCLVLSRLASCCLNLVCLALSHLVSSHLVLPCLALPWQGKARHWIWWCALPTYSCKQSWTSCSDLRASPHHVIASHECPFNLAEIELLIYTLLITVWSSARLVTTCLPKNLASCLAMSRLVLSCPFSPCLA